jgi:hypothetical protein
MATQLDTPVVVDSESGAINEVQSVKVDGTGGTFQLLAEGDLTAKLPFNATPAAVATALEDLPAIPEGSVTVSGGVGNSGGTNPYLVTFDGPLGGENVDLLGDADELTGGGADVTVTVVTAGKDPEEAGAVIRGTGLADRTEDVSPLTGKSPAQKRADSPGDFGD